MKKAWILMITVFSALGLSVLAASPSAEACPGGGHAGGSSVVTSTPAR